MTDDVPITSSDSPSRHNSSGPQDRRLYLGGSDARIIMGTDAAALVRLWREKRGEAEPEDLSGNLAVQFGQVTEALNRRWFARETGRRLVIANDTTQRQIDSIRMHGSVRGLTPMQALKAVMASTSLRFDLPAGAIRVSFAGESSTST